MQANYDLPEFRSPDLADRLPKDYPNLFNGRHGGEGVLKLTILAAVGGTMVIATGILGLRTGTEGSLAGAAFGAFAFALGLASLVNAWDVSDEVGEMLDNLKKDVRYQRKQAHRARQAPVIKEHDGAVEQATNIRAHAEAQGQAAAAAVRRMKFQALTRSAGVVGHGRLVAPAGSEADVPESEEAREPIPATAPRTNGHHPDREVPAPYILTAEEE